MPVSLKTLTEELDLVEVRLDLSLDTFVKRMVNGGYVSFLVTSAPRHFTVAAHHAVDDHTIFESGATLEQALEKGLRSAHRRHRDREAV